MTKMGFEPNQRLVREFKNQPVTATVGDKTYHFRSKLEYNWALYCQFRKETDLIKDWFYEQTTFRFEAEAKKKRPGVIIYLIDFDIRNNDDTFHYEECKGYLSARDRSKFRKVREYYPDTIIDLVMQSVPKSGSKGANSRRIALKYVRRIISAREIFAQMKGLINFE